VYPPLHEISCSTWPVTHGHYLMDNKRCSLIPPTSSVCFTDLFPPPHKTGPDPYPTYILPPTKKLTMFHAWDHEYVTGVCAVDWSALWWSCPFSSVHKINKASSTSKVKQTFPKQASPSYSTAPIVNRAQHLKQITVTRQVHCYIVRKVLN